MRLAASAYLHRVSIAEDLTDTDGNARPYSVSELSFALKRTLEDAYGFVRLRGELSKVTFHSNGHVYLSLKDDKACIDGVIWRSAARGMQVRPKQGMEVIVTGKITTYPAGSRYQIIIDTLEPAGVGALLAQLEKLKAKLQAEGLFEQARKRRLPSMPAVIGVVTSPTGAVIRDILHRIRDRWPCRVVVWPVVVQGEQAAAQVIAAIEGFNQLPAEGDLPRPQVLIVARGGGSVEDLWPFNDERLARAAAASAIPLISAVGHETDTTLIDYVCDRRAPTPTAAAEMATPVLAELKAAVADFHRRLLRSGDRALEHGRTRLTSASRGLPRPADLLALASQQFDNASSRLGAGLERNVAAHRVELVRVAGRLTPGLLDRPRRLRAERLAEVTARLRPAVDRLQLRLGERLVSLDKLRLSLNPDGPLKRGFARVHRSDGHLARTAAELAPGEGVRMVFLDGERQATVDGEPPASRRPRADPPPAQEQDLAATRRGKGVKPPDPNQRDLF